jgi:hypothetical protein
MYLDTRYQPTNAFSIPKDRDQGDTRYSNVLHAIRPVGGFFIYIMSAYNLTVKAGPARQQKKKREQTRKHIASKYLKQKQCTSIGNSYSVETTQSCDSSDFIQS